MSAGKIERAPAREKLAFTCCHWNCDSVAVSHESVNWPWKLSFSAEAFSLSRIPAEWAFSLLLIAQCAFSCKPHSSHTVQLLQPMSQRAAARTISSQSRSEKALSGIFLEEAETDWLCEERGVSQCLSSKCLGCELSAKIFTKNSMKCTCLQCIHNPL